MTVIPTAVLSPLVRYAATLHAAAGDRHHVASPLGAWLLLALCGPAAGGTTRDELTAVLGMDIEAAAQAAAALLGEPHPAVSCATGLWHHADVDADAFAGLFPAQVATGDLPDQAALDEWARRHTLGLINQFPANITPDTALVLASALATRVSWECPFEVVPAAALGADSAWAGQVASVLRTPKHYGHRQFVMVTERAGDVAVHLGSAREGLVVASVAAAAEVPMVDVLAAAYDIVRSPGDVTNRSLFDLPLGDSPLWTVTERVAQVKRQDGREEHCTAVLPAWSASSEHGLGAPALGFPSAARALAGLIGLPEYRYEAKQSAVARYSRVGFEAAAVTAMVMASALPMYRDGVVREAVLRFGHPYAAVAFVSDRSSPWHGVPVFSAWVREIEDAD
jgi:hypothetical protein